MKWFRRTEDRRLTPADLLTKLEEEQEVLDPLPYKPPSKVTARQDAKARHPAAQAMYLPVGAEQYLADASIPRLLRIAESLMRNPPEGQPTKWDVQVADALHDRAAQLDAEGD